MKVTHICMPQAPDKTRRWTTLVKLPGFPPSSIFRPEKEAPGKSEIYLCPVAFRPCEPAQGQGHGLSSRDTWIAAQEWGGEDPKQL